MGVEIGIGSKTEPFLVGLDHGNLGELTLLKALILAPRATVAFRVGALYLGHAIDTIGVVTTGHIR